MTDPVAEKSSFLCMYMSNHPDTLVAYVKHFGQITPPVSSARMASIDTKGMTLKYTVKGKGDTEEEVRVSFDPALAGYEEVKPRLLSMTADAQEALGMSKAPQITTFDISAEVAKTAIPILLLIYTTISPQYTGPFWDAGHWLFDFVGGSRTLKFIWAGVVAIHAFEGLYVQRLCVKHRTGFSIGFKYVISTFLFGFPILIPLRKKIQQARIDSIMKGN